MRGWEVVGEVKKRQWQISKRGWTHVSTTCPFWEREGFFNHSCSINLFFHAWLISQVLFPKNCIVTAHSHMPICLSWKSNSSGELPGRLTNHWLLALGINSPPETAWMYVREEPELNPFFFFQQTTLLGCINLGSRRENRRNKAEENAPSFAPFRVSVSLVGQQSNWFP